MQKCRMNNPEYFDNIAKKGSALHYSTLYLPPAQRQVVLQIYAFYQEILACLFDCSEVTVARIRLQWWRDEIDRAFAKQASHPIAIALTKTLENFSLNKKLFFCIINGFESYLDSPIFEHENDVFHFLSQTAGARELLTIQVTGEFPEQEKYAYQLGAGLELIYLIQNLRRYIDKGHFFFAQQQLDFSHCKLENFSQHKTTKEVITFLTKQSELAKKYLANAHQLMPPSQKHNMIRTKLALTLLSEIEKENFPVLTQYIELNPLRMLWISWRMKAA